MVALVDAGAIPLRRRDREADLEFAPLQLPCHLETGGIEHAEHGAILRHHLGDEALDPDLAGPPRELLQQPSADTAALVLVRDREGGFCCALVAEAHVLGDRDDAVAELTDEDAALTPVGL